MQLNNINGIEGQVALAGYKGAVAAMFLRWSLTRREERSFDGSWTLRAVLSFQKDSLLRNKAVGKRIFVKVSGAEWELVPVNDSPLVVEDGVLTVERVTYVKPGNSGKA